MSYATLPGQLAWDNRTDDRDDGAESHEMATVTDAIDHLNAAHRAFGNRKQAEAMGYIQEMVHTLRENDSIAAVLRSMDLSEKAL